VPLAPVVDEEEKRRMKNETKLRVDFSIRTYSYLYMHVSVVVVSLVPSAQVLDS
jgi:hypothetical protein